MTVAGLWPDELSLLKYILAVRVTGTDILITVNGKLSQQMKFEDLKEIRTAAALPVRKMLGCLSSCLNPALFSL